MNLEPTAGIYMIRRSRSEECYVGQSARIETRFCEHKSLLRCGKHTAKHMQHVFDKHGLDAFEFIILETGFDPRDRMAMTEAEQAWIDLVRPSYNVLSAAGREGPWHSPETCEKIRRTKLGSTHTPETKAKMSAAKMGNKNRAGHKPPHAGKKMPPEFGAKISAAKKGKPSPLLGRTLPPEVRAKISASKRGVPVSEAFKRNLSAARLGVPWSQARRDAYNRSKMAAAGEGD
jgi:group I intron endonuclease